MYGVLSVVSLYGCSTFKCGLLARILHVRFIFLKIGRIPPTLQKSFFLLCGHLGFDSVVLAQRSSYKGNFHSLSPCSHQNMAKEFNTWPRYILVSNQLKV